MKTKMNTNIMHRNDMSIGKWVLIMKCKMTYIFTFTKQFVHSLVNSSKKWYYGGEWRDQMGKNLYPKNMRLLKPYVDDSLYQSFAENPVWEEYAAMCLFAKIDNLYHITERVTPEWLRTVDIALKKDNKDLSELLNTELMRVSAKHNRYESEKKTPEYEKRKKEYEKEWERWSNES